MQFFNHKVSRAAVSVVLAICSSAAIVPIAKAQFIQCLAPSCSVGGYSPTIPVPSLPVDSGPIGPLPPLPSPGGGGIGPFGQGVVGGIGMGVGMGIVGALTQPRPQQVIVQQPPRTVVMPVQTAGGLTAHDQHCLAKYKSYNINTKRYLSYSGQYKLCISPFM